MFSVYSFSDSTCIQVAEMLCRYPQAIESEVERLWLAGVAQSGSPLFDGRVLSVIEVSPQLIVVREVRYRYVMAQRMRPELFAALQVRPLAVSGLFQCTDGIVFGRRSRTMTQDAGHWELVPSGAIDADRASQGGGVDYRKQILIELQEEVGLPAESIFSLTPFCLIDDHESRVLDIGIAIGSNRNAGAIQRDHRLRATKEYDELQIVPLGDIGSFVERKRASLSSLSALLLRQFGHHVTD